MAFSLRSRQWQYKQDNKTGGRVISLPAPSPVAVDASAWPVYVFLPLALLAACGGALWSWYSVSEPLPVADNISVQQVAELQMARAETAPAPGPEPGIVLPVEALRDTALAALEQQLRDTPAMQSAGAGQAAAPRPAVQAKPAIKVVDVPPERALMAEAARWQAQGNFQQAVSAWERAYAVAPQNDAVLTGYAVALTGLGTVDAHDRLARLSSMHRIAPVIAADAQALIDEGRLDAGFARMQEATMLDEGNLRYRLNLAIIADRRGDDLTALSNYREVLERNGVLAPAQPGLPMTMDAVRERARFLARRHGLQ
ncbi:MAG: hypothetical protein GC131_04930 [Alphaproteobacteria bacterium]|nr:hypothetical protein [Alphaproteobacteria bacterium]